MHRTLTLAIRSNWSPRSFMCDLLENPYFYIPDYLVWFIFWLQMRRFYFFFFLQRQFIILQYYLLLYGIKCLPIFQIMQYYLGGKYCLIQKKIDIVSRWMVLCSEFGLNYLNQTWPDQGNVRTFFFTTEWCNIFIVISMDIVSSAGPLNNVVYIYL